MDSLNTDKGDSGYMQITRSPFSGAPEYFIRVEKIKSKLLFYPQHNNVIEYLRG